MINDIKPIKGISDFSKDIKEASIRKHFSKPKPLTETLKRTDFLYCDPPEVILQNVEKNKMYEVPVKIYNISKKTKSVNIKHPTRHLFKVDTDKKNKRSQIAPGMNLEILVIFETDQPLMDDEFDRIEITSENDFKLTLNLKAYLPQPLIQFEPLINLGFVPVGTKKIETIKFLNDGSQKARIVLSTENKRDDLKLDTETFDIDEYDAKKSEDRRTRQVTVTFEPTETMNLHEKFEVKQIVANKPPKDLGFIEIIATSVVQQMSIVFEEGGGPQTDINFGLLYHGQRKECSAFLVNNGPKEMNFKFFFHPNKNRNDLKSNDEDDITSTPQEIGLEMTQRILSAEPALGYVKPYSQIPIKFLCSTKIKSEQKGWKVTLCPEYDENAKKQRENKRNILNSAEYFKSLAIIKFEEAFCNKLASYQSQVEEDFCKQISVYMEVKAILPDITIDKTSLNFWECNLKEKKVITVTITNKNDELPIDFSFNKVPHFTVEPRRGVIKPSYSNVPSQMTVQVFFHPENIGKFSDVLIMKYVNDMYEIPIRIFGICKGRSKYQLPHVKHDIAGKYTTYGKNWTNVEYVPDEYALDFTKPKKKKLDQNSKIQKLHQNRLEEVLSKIKNTDDKKTDKASTLNPSNELIKKFEDNFKIYSEIFNHKAKANAELVKMRRERLQRQMEQAKRRQKKTEHIAISSEDMQDTSSDDIFNLKGNRIDSPRLKLPEPKDTLWVVKPIGQYEPTYLEDTSMKEFKKSPDDLPENEPTSKGITKTGEVPRTHQEIRECSLELTGEDLQKIQVYPKELVMGRIFVKSERSQTFWIKNNHRNHIFVNLELDNSPDLQKSYPKSHVIGPGETQGFRITVYSNLIRNVVYSIKYTINYKHAFKLRVPADIIKVQLDCNPPEGLQKFEFSNLKLSGSDKNMDMSVSHKVRLANEGNAVAKVKWDEPKEKSFIINPMKLEIPSKEVREVTITFNPFMVQIQKEKYSDDLLMRIENGDIKKYSVEGLVKPCIVKFFNLPNDTITYDLVHTGVPAKKSFMLKNETSRVVTAYQVQNPFEEILTFKEPCGFLTDKAKTIEVTLLHKEPNPNFEVEVPILIRGAPKLVLKIKAYILEPKVTIVQKEFDFKGVSYGESSTLPLTFQNNSKLPASIEVDMDVDNYIKNFKLTLPEKTKNDRPGLIVPKSKPKELQNEIDEDMDIEEEENNEEQDDEKGDDLRQFTIILQPEESVDFDFTFCPTSLEIQDYDFDINFNLVGASVEYKGLKRPVKGKKMPSIIQIPDTEIKFPETFIYENTNNSESKEFSIYNVVKKPLIWEFILSDEFVNEQVFSVSESKGEIPDKDSSSVSVTFRFAPKAQREYKTQITLKVTINDGSNQVTRKELKLQGVGLLPRLYFDRRELILPIVPLDYESSIKFKVKNKGYVNEEIRAEFEVYPQGALPLTLEWADKNHSVGYNTNELKCEVKFKYNKPLTFTTRLIFYDKENQSFPITVAGTTDNCLLTNYSFFQRNDRDNFDFILDYATNSINLKPKEVNTKEEDDVNNSKTSKDDDKKSEKGSSSYVGSTGGSPSVLLGYSKINKKLIELNCKRVSRYLRKIHLDEQFILNNNIGKKFPEEFLREDDNCKFIYVLIKNLIGKEPPGKITGELSKDPFEKVKQIREQYCQLLRYLQECGACLNTVFPEYLMSYENCRRYIQNDKSREKVLAPNWDKGSTFKRQHEYYYKESWVLLVYQILKIFYLARVNTKTFPLVLRHLPEEVQMRHKSIKYGPSNVYSTSEYLLLRWLQACSEFVNPANPKRPKTFDNEDFVDSSLLTSLILSYFPKEDTTKKGRNQNNETKMISYTSLFPIFQKYGIYTHVKKINVQFGKISIDARDMVLFLSMLFQNFQYFAEKKEIEFSCILGDSLVKSISLKNNTNKPLEYSVKFDADECFKPLTNTDLIKIDPNGGETEYQIKFTSKISNSVFGKVFFINKKMGWASQAAPIVYNLVSKITGRKSIETIYLQTFLYSKYHYDKLIIKNPFAEKEKGVKHEFEVRIEQKYKSLPKKKDSKGRKEEANDLLYKVFTFDGGEDKKMVKFQADGTYKLTINFWPIEMKTYECNLIFISEKVGEFQYSIEGRVVLPTPRQMEYIERTCNVDELKEFDLDIKMRNQYLERALEEIIPNDNVTLKDKAGNTIAVTRSYLKQKFLPQTDKLSFTVESSKNFYIVPPTVMASLSGLDSNAKSKSNAPIQNSNQQGNSSASGNSQQANNANMQTQSEKNEVFWLKVKFTSKICMVYEGDITLRNINRENDIRIYKLYVDVKPKVIRATLEFFCPVKEVITQKIPIENKSDKDWKIKGELTGQTNGFFKHMNELNVYKHSIADYQLIFAPTEKVTCTGTLKLVNNYTSETYFYTLIGNVEDPLAEGNIEILGINAKETEKRNIEFENEGDTDIVYTVETDLDEIISGLSSFTVQAGKKFTYEMKVRPLLGKIYFGRIIFRDNKGNYKWYTVRVQANCQIQTQEIEMRTKIRKAVAIKIKLENPLNEPCIFRIDFDSDYYLFGDREVRVEPHLPKPYQYKLIFAPLKVDTWKDVMLHIYNDKIGEYLYNLKLICDEPEQIVSEVIQAELGKFADYSAMLENPTQDEVEVTYENDNPRIYQVLQEKKIIIPSGIKREILIRYTPSNLGTEEICNIIFKTKTIGNWNYLLRGKGTNPKPMPITYCRTFVGNMTSGQISFRNPLGEKTRVTFELKNYPSEDNAFSLFVKKNYQEIDAYKSFLIPFTFKPKILTKYSAELIVRISKTLFWTYPIEGITEEKSKGIDFVFKSKAKQLFTKQIELDLSSLPDGQIDFADFMYVVNIKEEKYKSLINKCLTINFVEKNSQRNLSQKVLPLDIKFYPLRPFKTEVEFVLRRKSGGQWIYNIILEATEPDPDDIITIKSPFKKESFVSFKLQNIFTKESKFIAYFSHDSSSEFSVSPREGVLDQSGKDGTNFVICYLPKEYGKIKIGKLIIETDEVQWIFEVRGNHLDYKPPDIKKTDVTKKTKAQEIKNMKDLNKK